MTISGPLFLFKVLLISPGHTSKCGEGRGEEGDVMGAPHLLEWYFLEVVLFRKGTMVLRCKWKNKD